MRVGSGRISFTLCLKAYFWRDVPVRPVQTAISSALPKANLCLGHGNPPLEIVYSKSSSLLSKDALRSAWKTRSGGRAAPVLLVVLYAEKASVAGPGGDPEHIVTDVDQAQMDGICRLR